MEIKVDESTKYVSIGELKAGDVFSFDSRFWLLLIGKTPQGSYRAANLGSGAIGYFAEYDRVIPRPDLYLTQK